MFLLTRRRHLRRKTDSRDNHHVVGQFDHPNLELRFLPLCSMLSYVFTSGIIKAAMESRSQDTILELGPCTEKTSLDANVKVPPNFGEVDEKITGVKIGGAAGAECAQAGPLPRHAALDAVTPSVRRSMASGRDRRGWLTLSRTRR